MKRYLFFLLVFINQILLFSQNENYIFLTPLQVEELFLKNNLLLIAEKMNIDIADAAIAQAKIWENPNLTISDVNLWSSRSQREGEDEVIPPLWGSFGKNTEFSVELSQLIQTANKRGKLIRLEKVSKEIAIEQFNETLRGLKAELRKTVNDIQYLQSYSTLLTVQHESFSKLIEAYRKQVAEGNLPKSELLRLQASFLEIESELNENRTELNEQQNILKVLINIEGDADIFISEIERTVLDPETLFLGELIVIAENIRPDLKAAKLQTQYYEKSLAYERSLKVPDVTVSANYDRYGGVWKNFIGFGISVDLPVFNRNQGDIKAAKIGREQANYLAELQQKSIRQEVITAYKNYKIAYDSYLKINDDDLLSDLDAMLEVYSKNLLNRNVSMIEYTDFMDSYRSTKETVLSAEKNVNDYLNELQYIIGTELK